MTHLLIILNNIVLRLEAKGQLCSFSKASNPKVRASPIKGQERHVPYTHQKIRKIML